MTIREKYTTISTMEIEARVLIRRIHAVLLNVACVALVSSCVTAETANAPAPPKASPADIHDSFGKDIVSIGPDAFRYEDARNTVRAGLRSIFQRYIDPVDQDHLALEGLQGLSSIDPDLDVSDDDGVVVLRLNDTIIATFPHPDDADAEDWAELTTSLIRTARSRSLDLAESDNERVYEALFDGMLGHLDIFSRYAGAVEARANRARRDGFGGIGVRFSKSSHGALITHVQHDSPAERAGLHPGDVIVKINDTAAGALSLRQVASMLRGPVGSLMTLTVTRVQGEPQLPDRRISFSLARAHIVPETVRATVLNDILLVRISSFNKKTSSRVHAVLQDHQEAFAQGRLKGVVLDVRDNPGGLLSQSVTVADLFLDTGRIIATRGRHPDSFHNYNAGGTDLTSGAPIAILVDGNSASAAEIVASALQDLGRAVVVGSTSYGKGTVQTVIRLPNDGEITLTWSRLVSPSGYALHGLGVFPVVCAASAPMAPETAAILTPDRIDAQRNTFEAWRAAGQIFDERRAKLRKICPTQAFDPGKNDKILMLLAAQLIEQPTLYRRAVQLSEPISTAARP